MSVSGLYRLSYLEEEWESLHISHPVENQNQEQTSSPQYSLAVILFTVFCQVSCVYDSLSNLDTNLLFSEILSKNCG